MKLNLPFRLPSRLTSLHSSLAFYFLCCLIWVLATTTQPHWSTEIWKLLPEDRGTLIWRILGIFTERDFRMTGLYLMLAGYLLLLSDAAKYPTPRLRPLLATAAMIGIPYLFTLALYSVDIYEYLIRGRMWAIHDLNPFLVNPSAVPTERLFPNVHWVDIPWVYGPVWLYLITPFSCLPVPTGLMLAAVKSLVLTAHLLSGWMIWRLLPAADPAARTRGTAIYLLSPLALFESAANGHCDAVLIVFLLAGYLLASQGRRAWASAAFMSAALVKIYAGPVLFFYFLASVAGARRGERLRVAAAIVGPAAVLAALTYLPFFTSLDVLKAPFTGGSSNKVTNSWATGAEEWLRMHPRGLITVGTSFGLLLVLVCSGLSWRFKEWKRTSGWFALLWAAVGATWYMPWYGLMPLALAIPTGDRILIRAASTLAFLSMLIYLVAVQMVSWDGRGWWVIISIVPQTATVGMIVRDFALERRRRLLAGDAR